MHFWHVKMTQSTSICVFSKRRHLVLVRYLDMKQCKVDLGGPIICFIESFVLKCDLMEHICICFQYHNRAIPQRNKSTAKSRNYINVLMEIFHQRSK